MSKTGFLVWEVSALFFILTYDPLVLGIVRDNTISTALSIFLRILWVVLSLFCVMLGLYSLKDS